MKRIVSIGFLILLIGLLSACKGSDTIQGVWKGQNSDGKNVEIKITENEIIITDESEEIYEYKQNAIGTENGIKYYGITIDKVQYSVIFPVKEDKNIALFMEIKEENYLFGTLVFALNKEEKPDYMEYGTKYLK